MTTAVAHHPVLDVLHERLRSRCEPGARTDPHKVAVVLEGGGMRGVVSAGMTAALERLGLTRCFDLVVGSSAGALNAAALLAGVARPAAAMYHTVLASREFVNPVRLLFGRPALDVRFVLAHAGEELDAERHERTIASPIPLHCVALDVDSARSVEFSGMRTKDELWNVLLATTRMPWIGGPPVAIDGRRYIDGALNCPIPIGNAIEAGATHVLVLQTRPYGVPRSAGGRVGEALIARHLRRLNPALVLLWHARIEAYEALVERIARQSESPNGDGPYVLGLRPPAGTPVVTQLERRPEVLARAAADAERLVEQTLGG
ncbi:MAG TPA: patatin-like phospholipase family protein [Solirubrobacteraceae bacterium]|jgi:predicted patatin/cPLA2 family phospholipase